MKKRVDMKKRERKNKTVIKEEDEVPSTSASGQRNEDGKITNAATSSPPKQGVILNNDDSGSNKSFLSSSSYIHNYAKPPSHATPVDDADSSLLPLSKIEGAFGIGTIHLGKDPFFCDEELSFSYSEGTLSVTESPAGDPGSLSSHLFEPASLQLLPEAQLNLPLETPPNYAGRSSSGERGYSQSLPKTRRGNSSVVSDDQSNSTCDCPRSSVAGRGVKKSCTSRSLPGTRSGNLSVVSDGQSSSTGACPESSVAGVRKPCTFPGLNEPCTVAGRGVKKSCTSRSLPGTRSGNSSVVSDGQSSSTGACPASSVAGVRKPCTFPGLNEPCTIPDCESMYRTSHNFDFHIRWEKRWRSNVCTWGDCGKIIRTHHDMLQHLRTHSAANRFICRWKGGCNSSFTNVSEFSRHFNLHSTERPYICEKCGDRFETSQNLDDHRVTHDSE